MQTFSNNCAAFANIKLPPKGGRANICQNTARAALDVPSADYLQTLDRLKAEGRQVEQVAVIKGGYRITVAPQMERQTNLL